MDGSQLTQVLQNCQSPDQNVRQMAEKWLQEAQKQNLALFLQLLCVELASEDKPPQTRTLAGLIVKNSLTAKDESRRMQLSTQWVQLDTNLKTQIKQAVISTLSSNVRDARSAAAQVASKIAVIELPNNMWPELIPALLANMDKEDNLKQSSLETLGYVCEEIPVEILQPQSNQILTAVCKGMKDPNNDVKLAGCNALYNALEFVKSNFENEGERNYIMQVLCDACIVEDIKVRIAGMECMVKIASLYYEKLAPYMQKIFNITLEAIKKDQEPVAQQAVEFWSTVCDEEIYLAEELEEAEEMKVAPSQLSQHFIRGALKYLIPLLTETLTRQEDEPDEDTWNVAMAAGTCLSLVAATVGDEVVPQVMPFVQNYINHENWKFREAATLAFGAILEGPKELTQLIAQAMPVLLTHLKGDPVVYVKDTTAWTVGRVCQLHPAVVASNLTEVMTVLASSLQDSPRVSANVCWAIHNLSLAFEDDQDKPSSGMSPFFQGLLKELLQVTEREDADESNLRCSAYEAVNVLIQCGAQDTLNAALESTPLFLDRLEKTFSMQIVSIDDKEEQTELQSLLCGVLQVIIQKLGDAIKPFADKMMQLFLQVFSAKSASVHEEALMAVGAIANAVEADFEKYMPHFRPFLTLGLRNSEEHSVCAVAVGVVGDISRALVNKLTPYCDEIVTLLLQNLQNPQLNRNVKPPILSCFGDIALAIGGEFVKYLGAVMAMLQQASTTTVDQSDYDLVDYLNQLREGIFEAYTGIIQGLRSDGVAEQFLPYVSHVINFVGFVFSDATRSDSVTRGAVGVLGDIGHSLSGQVKPHLSQPFVKELINECLKSDSPQTQDVANWTKEVIAGLG